MNYYKVEIIYINYQLYNYIAVYEGKTPEDALRRAQKACDKKNKEIGNVFKKAGKVICQCDKWGNNL